MGNRPGVTKGVAAVVTLVIGAATAVAQSGRAPDPTDPGAAAPAIKYDSALAEYQPFREPQIRPWAEVNQEVAANASVKDVHDTHSKSDVAPPRMTMPAEVRQAPTMSMSSGRVVGDKVAPRKHTHDRTAVAMARPHGAGHRAHAQAAGINGTGVVRAIDKVNGKVRLTHDAIPAMGWPTMTLFFRLKDRALADQVKEGEKVEFALEKLASGYVISAFRKNAERHATSR